MASGVFSIPKDFYIKVQDYFIDELIDKYPSGIIPMVNEDGEPYISRIPYMESVDVSMAVLDWNAEQAAAQARLKYLDVTIAGRQIKLAFSARDTRRSGPLVLAAKTKTIIAKFLDEIDDAIWHGNYEGTVLVSSGVISQLAIINTSKITEAQATGNIVFLNMKAMVQEIAAKYRSLYPIALLMDWTTYDLGATQIATGYTKSAMAVFKEAYPNVTVIPTDTILASADVAGTNGRMIAFAQNEDLIRNILAKAPSPVGPAIVDLTGSIGQLWGTLWGVKVIQSTATAYTDTTLTF